MISISRKNRVSAVAFFAAALISAAIAENERPAADVTTQAEHAVFMGYNLKNYLRMPRRGQGEAVEDRPKPESEILGVVTMITKARPDIVGLIEIGTRNDVEDLQQRLKACGLNLPHAVINHSFDPLRRLALISRFPVIATNHQSDLTYPLARRQMPFSRGILDATIQVNDDYQLRVLGVHLKSKREVPEADQALMRRYEAHLTRQHAEAIIRADPETNLILFGDFNDTRNEEPIRAIQGKYGTPGYFKDVSAMDDLGYTWTYFWSHADQYSRFDYLFVNKGLLPEIVDERSFIVSDPVWFTGSDHRPVVTTIVAEDR